MNKKTVIWIIAAVAFVAGVVTACIVFRKQISDLFARCKEKCRKDTGDAAGDFTPEEFEDFADI